MDVFVMLLQRQGRARRVTCQFHIWMGRVHLCQWESTLMVLTVIPVGVLYIEVLFLILEQPQLFNYMSICLGFSAWHK